MAAFESSRESGAGGECRSRQGTAVRPTPDRVRETLFNWLRDDVAGARCLDLYAGTGALGFEALSRGAAEAWFVEQDPVLVAALGVPGGSVRRAAAHRSPGRGVACCAAALRRRFDLVFLDPPYALPVEPLLALLPPWLSERALVYVERPRSPGLAGRCASGSWLKRSHAGAVEYGLFRFGAAV